MKAPGITYGLLSFFLFAESGLMMAQTGKAGSDPVEQVVQRYKDYSALGSSGSIFMDEAAILAFKDLFEPDANIYWDLWKDNTRKIPFLLTVDEYVDSARRQYTGKKPVISYGNYHISYNPEKRSATAWLHKVVYTPDPRDTVRYRMSSRSTNLRLFLTIRNDSATIQNITEDTRLTRIRSLSLEGCYYFSGQVNSGFFGTAESSAVPAQAASFSFGNSTGYHVGLNMDIRLDRTEQEGLLINLGLCYFRSDLAATITEYEGSYRQTFDPGSNAFESSVFDRSPEITEKISMSGIALPVTLRWFFSRQFYLKAGPRFSYSAGTSRVDYQLSHTGGGKYFLLREAGLPPDQQHWFYLDRDHEMADASYGFFRDRDFSCSLETGLRSFNVSAVFSVGFETRVKKILIGIEPWMTIGITSLVKSRVSGYPLYPESEYSSFLLTCSNPRLNTFGINVFIGRMFSR